MTEQQIQAFFIALSELYNKTCQVILLGAGAGALYGNVRPSLDIDFEIQVKGAKNKMALQEAIEKTSKATGIAVNYAENVSGWSMINFLDYRKTAVPYQQFGKLTVKLMHPAYWTIGKMTRFLELDIQDMVKVIQAKHLKSKELVHLWVKALRQSELSLASGQFRQQVHQFLKQYAKKCWGSNTSAEELIDLFETHLKK